MQTVLVSVPVFGVTEPKRFHLLLPEWTFFHHPLYQSPLQRPETPHTHNVGL